MTKKMRRIALLGTVMAACAVGFPGAASAGGTCTTQAMIPQLYNQGSPNQYLAGDGFKKCTGANPNNQFVTVTLLRSQLYRGPYVAVKSTTKRLSRGGVAYISLTRPCPRPNRRNNVYYKTAVVDSFVVRGMTFRRPVLMSGVIATGCP